MKRRANRQLDLFPPAPIGHNGAPARSRESDRLYTRILFLRIYGGKSVFRVGREHLVAGRQISTGQLQQFVAAESSRLTGNNDLPDYVLRRLGMS